MADPNDGKMFLQVIEKSGTDDVGPATCRYMHNRLRSRKKYARFHSPVARASSLV